MNRGNRSSLLLAVILTLGCASSAAALDIDLRTSTGFIVWGARFQDNTGRAVAFGDLDGDGYKDIITGSIGVDGNGQTIANSGAVNIVWGDTRVNLGTSKDLLTQTDVRIEGADTGDQVGIFVVSGDFDNDGLDDLAMGASLGDGPGNIRPDCGDVYIFYGRARAAWTGITNVTQRDVIVYGADAGDNSGISLAVGDIDGDTADDLLIGGSGMDGPANARVGCGGLHVVYGGPRPEGGAIDLGAVTLIDGTDAGDLTGRSVAAGDLDGDGFDDIICGVPNGSGPLNARSQGGEVAVVWGRSRATMGQYRDLATGTDVILWGRDLGDACGTWVNAADYDGDGKDDLLVGSPLGDAQANARVNCGEVYVMYGKPRVSWGATYDFTAGIVGVGKAFMGDGAGDLLGSALTGGDMDGDGKDDLALGAPLADGLLNARTSSGEVYVYFGLPRGSSSDTTTVGVNSHLRILGADAGDRTGTIMDMGELDGYPDNLLELAMGGPNGDSNANSRFDGGEVAIIHGFTQAVPALLEDVQAAGDGSGGAAIAWSTSQQDGIRGFNLYRVVGGAFERVNATMIPAAIGEAGSYRVVDTDAHAFVTGYEIRQLDGRGRESFLGYVAFTPSAAPVDFAIRRLASPFAGSSSFSLALPSRLAGASYSVALYDNAGRMVQQLAKGTVASNSLEVGIAGANLRAGVYHVRAIAGDLVTTAKVVKL